MQRENLVIKGHVGKWYVVEEGYHLGQKVYLVESEIYGNDAAHLIIDNNLNIILGDVWNGFSDLDDM